MSDRSRGESYAGKGYGTRRRLLFEAARVHIECAVARGFFCEAIAVSESIIADRLESRLSWLTKQNLGFKTLGWLIRELRKCESDRDLIHLLNDLDAWCERRNSALHEMVKVADEGPVPDWQTRPTDWDVRMRKLEVSASDGYELVKRTYHRVADLNPRHHDRVFPYPERSDPSDEPGAAVDGGAVGRDALGRGVDRVLGNAGHSRERGLRGGYRLGAGWDHRREHDRARGEFAGRNRGRLDGSWSRRGTRLGPTRGTAPGLCAWVAHRPRSNRTHQAKRNC